MKISIILTVVMGLIGCQSIRDNQQQEYILRLADKCEVISISSRGTDLECPNYREMNRN